MARVDSLIRELSERHGNTDRVFLTAVRPLVVKILDDATPVAARVPLLELLAETFERDEQIRRDIGQARVHWRDFVQSLLRLLGG